MAVSTLQNESSVKQDFHSAGKHQAQSAQELVTSAASYSRCSGTCKSLAVSCKLRQAKLSNPHVGFEVFMHNVPWCKEESDVTCTKDST